MRATELAVPSSRSAVLALDSRTLYALERAGEIAREILDDRIVQWTEEGWTQQKIADEIGCSQRAISKRQGRLGIKPSRPHKPHVRKIEPGSNSENGSDPVEAVEDVEVMSEGPSTRAPSEPQLEDWLPDMLPGAEPEGAFRQEVKAWCDQERSISTAMDETGIGLVPKSERDRHALLARLAEIHGTAARLERNLGNGQEEAAA